MIEPWASDRSVMQESTMRALMLYNINFGLSCNEFFCQNKKKDILRKVQSSEKYDWRKKQE